MGRDSRVTNAPLRIPTADHERAEEASINPEATNRDGGSVEGARGEEGGRRGVECDGGCEDWVCTRGRLSPVERTVAGAVEGRGVEGERRERPNRERKESTEGRRRKGHRHQRRRFRLITPPARLA